MPSFSLRKRKIPAKPDNSLRNPETPTAVRPLTRNTFPFRVSTFSSTTSVQHRKIRRKVVFRVLSVLTLCLLGVYQVGGFSMSSRVVRRPYFLHSMCNG